MDQNNEFLNNLKELLSNKENMHNTLSLIALFICVYEKFTKINVDRIKELFTVETIEAGVLIEKVNPVYYSKIKKRKYKGRTNILRSSMLYFVVMGAISRADFKSFLKLKDRRNMYAHEMTDVMLKGLKEDDIDAMMSLLEIFKKLDVWWLENYEMALGGEDIDATNALSLALGIYAAMFEVLFLDGEEEYKKAFENMGM